MKDVRSFHIGFTIHLSEICICFANPLVVTVEIGDQHEGDSTWFDFYSATCREYSLCLKFGTIMVIQECEIV